ncbi:hypothetical protein ACQ4N7_17805 [Nodosilinea sp. AN01ver1]|uniref:hypothetical protein n=1 Tax=Nodosilinea sp. AN01ver1 TaxID=3423362 RepID=UPI003D3210C6
MFIAPSLPRLNATAKASQQRSQPPLIEHPFGYVYRPIWHNRFWEVLSIIWGDRQTSKPHCHQVSFNLTRVQSGCILERKYRTSGGQLVVASERVLTAGQWTWTLPFQVHELIGLGDRSQTLHFYFPGRKSTVHHP